MSIIFANVYHTATPAELIFSVLVQDGLFESAEMDEAIQKASNFRMFSRVHFIGDQTQLQKLIDRFENGQESWVERINKLCPSSNIFTITFDTNSSQYKTNSLSSSKNIPNDTLSVEQTFGVQQIFISGDGLNIAPEGFHFGKPSKKHSKKFLRASNVFERGGAVAYIAFWLLKYIDSNTRRIFVDTSGISSVATTLAYMSYSLGIVQSPPVVDSHASYGGLKRLRIENPQNTLCLLSASTSGNLALDLIQQCNARADHIITLFYVGDFEANAGNLLCNLTKDEKNNPFGIDRIESAIHDNCHYCKNGDLLITLEGDQFSTAPVPIERISLRVPAAKAAGLLRGCTNLFGKSCFKINRIVDGKLTEIFLDCKAIIESLTDDQKNLWDSVVMESFPISLRRIISTSYPFSDDICNILVDKYKIKSTLPDVSIFGASALNSDRDIEQFSTTTVISSCISDPSELFTVNFALRQIQPNGNANYISLAVLSQNDEEKRKMISSLTFGKRGNNTYNFKTVFDIKLPANSRENSWTKELDALQIFVDWCYENCEAPDEIERRIEALQKSTSGGLEDNLFWPSCNGMPLAIRSDYTVIDTSDRCSQADIYVSISSLLHCHREHALEQPKLQFNRFRRVILDADNITSRFTDPILQASILRASRNNELSYHLCEDSNSKIESYICVNVIDSVEKREDDALAEFLVAILVRQLTLNLSSIANIVSKIRCCPAVPNHLKLLARYIIEQQ